MASSTTKRYANKIENYLSRQFRDCYFVVRTAWDNEIIIDLKEGNFYPVDGDINAWKLKNSRTPEALDLPNSVSSYISPQELSNIRVSSLSLQASSYKLSVEAKEVFVEVFRYIVDNFSRSKKVRFAFTIGANYINNNIGTIAKPTEIDHKTFKGRKRRSVAEAIVRGWEG